MPVKVNANRHADRGVFVFMVTSGGSGYPNGTFYTKLRGDGSGGIAKLVVSGGSIQVFGDGSSNSSMQTEGTGYSFASFDLTGSTNIFTDASASTLISGQTLTDWNATAASIKPII